MKKTEDIILNSKCAHQEMIIEEQNSAEYNWLRKEVIASKMIWKDGTLKNLVLKGKGDFCLSSSHTHGSKESICIKTETDIADGSPRHTVNLKIPVENEDWTKYNRLSFWVFPESIGFHNFYFHFSIYNKGTKPESHAPSLIPNQWNHVVWEFPYLTRQCIEMISISPFLFGCPDEALSEVKFHIDDIELQYVDSEYIDGWNTEERIAYSHIGYLKDSKKIALTQDADEQMFFVKDEKNQIILEKEIKIIKTRVGIFQILDFSEISDEGIYYITLGDRKTNLFSISNHVYDLSIWKTMNFFRMLRCGEEVEHVHSACHLTSYTHHPDGRMLPNFGGWHDAGDVSQFEICTAEMTHALLDLAENFKFQNEELYHRILEEARVGANWLLRTTFGDGYRALAVTYSVWTKSIAKDREHINLSANGTNLNVAENGPFENFLAAAALARAARSYSNDLVFSNWCQRVAMNDFHHAVEGYQNGIYTKRWGPSIDSQVAGSGALAAVELFLLTEDIKYKEQAIEYAQTIMNCQETTNLNWKTPIRGFFYEDASHTHILTYEHRGHEQSPIHGLAKLVENFPDHPNFSKWVKSLELYEEYVIKTMELMNNPYQLLPAQIYHLTQLNLDRFTIPKSWGTEEEIKEDFTKQIKDGISLSDHIYLRQFPIAIQRKGYHATLLSKTKAISLIAKVLKKDYLKEITIHQLEWILGKNPFSSSTMYGEGYRYHPLYVAFSQQMVGALPVGFKTNQEKDAPFWPVTNNAVFKEIWGHTSGKYLWVLADIL